MHRTRAGAFRGGLGFAATAGRRSSELGVIAALAIVMSSLFVTTYSLALGDPVPRRIDAALVGDPRADPGTAKAVQGSPKTASTSPTTNARRRARRDRSPEGLRHPRPSLGEAASLVKARRDPSARAHAGSLRGHPPAEASAEP